MLILVSQIVVLAIAALVLVLAAWGVVMPDKLITFVVSSMDRPWGIHIAVFVRLVLGAALIAAAPASLFPVTFEVLGVVTILAAVALAIAGQERVRRFLDWWVEQFSPRVNRLWLLFGVAFAAFLVYAVV